MALVITLILLSVTLVMAVAFLAISRRERNAVTTVTDTASARLAADAALANAEAQIVANIFATTNAAAYNFGLLVSTNYINGYGFNPAGGANPTNVNFSYKSDGTAFTSGDLNQDFANLFYLPRAPVLMSNLVTHVVENRFYLDLNRNGVDDPNGWVTNLDNNGNGLGTVSFQVGDPEWIGVLDHPDAPHGPNNRFVSRYAFIAVPVGNTLDLNAIHNQVFDENNALNAGVNPPPPGNGDAFFRNEGVGSWEINLAAFLADLNTNEWGRTIDPPSAPPSAPTYYQYNEPANFNQGFAFEDARALLAYRYANNYNSLASVQSLYLNGPFAFQNDNIDGYSDGPLLTTFNTNELFQPDNPRLPWAGADNTNQFFTHQELFDPVKTSVGFTNHLWSAGTNVSTYDRYTFYRMLDELGSDSAPESGKINLNYSNAVVQTGLNGMATNIAVVPGAETNFVPWAATNFFTAAADRMLRLYTTNWFQSNPSNYLATFYGIATNYYYVNGSGNVVTNDPTGLGLTNISFLLMTNQVPAFGITNIPVLINGNFVYSPAVNRLLQLAANIYDATTNYFYPHVFRPTFWVNNAFGSTNVFITGYQEVPGVSGYSDPRLNPPVDVTNLLLGASTANYPNGVNVYGVPWIIGAKKGFPNFNEFSAENVVQITRKLQIARNLNVSPTDFIYTNEAYFFSISNSLGVECWNSYTNAYPNLVQVVVRDNLAMQMMLTNGILVLYQPNLVPPPQTTNVVMWTNSTWQSTWQSGQVGTLNPSAASPFIMPLYTNVTFLTNSVYRFIEPFGGYSVPGFIPTGANPDWETNVQNLPALPQMILTTANRLQVFMLDGQSTPNGYHVIDYVHFSGPNSSRNLNSEFQTTNTIIGNTYAGYTNMWSTALNLNGIPIGIAQQIYVSDHNAIPTFWQSDPLYQYEIDGFALFMGLTPPYPSSSILKNGLTQSYATNWIVQVPYLPVVTIREYSSWQANDPLVHYLVGDLEVSDSSSTPPTGITVDYLNQSPPPLLPNIGALNRRYAPWGVVGAITANTPDVDQNPYNLAYKDPLMWQSDFWNFPTNKFPTAGWLGRVHRGTPWQTVFLKATNILTLANSAANGLTTWVNCTGNGNLFDAANSAPVWDRLLFDVFTTAFNDNATRGQLSVNVGGANGHSLAAWSALFSGVVALTNTASFPQSTGPSNRWVVINPAGGAGTNSPLGQMVVGINNTRANTNLFPLQVFGHVGDILATPQLTEQSPFLNLNNTFQGGQQQQYGISDEVYEWLPQQVMSLLREGSPRYVIYCYGQALRPAPNSLVTSGGNSFGMCTNYQVVAESAARAVVRVDGAGTPAPHVVVETYNPLPPD